MQRCFIFDLQLRFLLLKGGHCLAQVFLISKSSLLFFFPLSLQHYLLMQITFSKPLYPLLMLFQVTEWPVGNQGLLYDRNWMIVNQNGVCVTQKQEPSLCLVNPSIDLKKKVMFIQAEG